MNLLKNASLNGSFSSTGSKTSIYTELQADK